MVQSHETVSASRRLSILLIALSIASLVSISPSVFHSVHAAGLVYVDRPTTAVGSASTVVTVRVQVAGVDPFNGWDIQVESNQSVISPISLSITGNGLEVNYSENVLEIVSCINGVSYTTNPCDSSDGPGIVHSEAVAYGNPPTSSAYGLLLLLNASSTLLSPNHPSNVTLTIATDTTYQANQYTVMVTATSNGLSHTAIVSISTTDKPDFVIDVSPSVLEIHAASSGSSIISVSTQSDFSSLVRLSVTVPLVPGLNASLGAKDLMISPGRPATTHLDFQTPDSPIPFVYRVNITATNQFSSHTVTVIVIPPQPDFIFLLSSTSHMVQGGESRTFTLAMTSVDYFKSQLVLFASSRLGFEEVFSPPTIALDFGNSSTSTMTLTTDASSEPGNRTVTLTDIGTTSIRARVMHIIVLTLTITRGPSSNTILVFMSLTYLGAGAVGALSLATI